MEEKQEKEEKQEATPKKVELDEDTYAALLDKIDELEKAMKPQKRQERTGDDVEDLAEEGRRGAQEDTSVNIDEFTPSQLVSYLNRNFSQQVAPLLVAVNEVKYSLEMDKLMRPKDMGGNGFDDLLDYREEIMELMIDNPKMTMKRAYTLAKAENPKKSEATRKATTEGDERETRLRHLPPHPRKGPFGERPGSAEASVTDGEPKSLKDAASKAFDKVMKDR